MLIMLMMGPITDGCQQPRSRRPPLGATTFQCSGYDIWDQKPKRAKTYTVPKGDFCSEPWLPDCATLANADALTVDINDGEGTECKLDLQTSPGTQKTV